jgi:3-hydroxybutyryl-CoA dehydrogenase
MGSGIAYVSALTGYTVHVVEQNEELLQKGLRRVREHVITGVNKGKLTPKQAEETMKKIKGTTRLGKAVEQVDLAIEAVFEDLNVKKKLFAELDKTCPAHTVLASNTSSLSISEVASATKRPDKVIGMHFFNPVPAMKLVEIVIGTCTSMETRGFAEAFAKSLGKETVTVKDSPGFIVNRVLGPMLNEVTYLLYEGKATAEDIDKAMMLGMNLPMGPLRLADYVGLDIALATVETLHKAFGEKYKPCPLLVELAKSGKLGMKTGKGFYEYH